MSPGRAADAALTPAPLITAEQLALEAKARELWGHPRVKGALAKAKAFMLAGYATDVPLAAQHRFDWELNEYGFAYGQRVLCRDRNNFCLYFTCHPPYARSDGLHIPGSRFYGENPDCVYRWGGLHDDRSCKIHSRPSKRFSRRDIGRRGR